MTPNLLLQNTISKHLRDLEINPDEVILFERLLSQEIYQLDEQEISSTGYVLDTLEASVWCLLTTENYKDAVLKAVNLGNDTDTTAAVTGGLAGLLYTADDIPPNWLDQLARKEDIFDLAERLSKI